jgi:hypothetical protein
MSRRGLSRRGRQRWRGTRRRSPRRRRPLTNGIDTAKTIANYYAYATTVFDYIRRAMPYSAPRSLADDEVYALTAYILSLNKLMAAAHAVVAWLSLQN